VYGVRPDQIIASPEWKPIVGWGNRYHIQAKAADESATTPVLKEMVKTLLADRFGLLLHKEMRDLPVYALVVARGGVKGAHALEGQAGGSNRSRTVGCAAGTSGLMAWSQRCRPLTAWIARLSTGPISIRYWTSI
jgi:uncharacterized protein (TIGR03435 family)